MTIVTAKCRGGEENVLINSVHMGGLQQAKTHRIKFSKTPKRLKSLSPIGSQRDLGSSVLLKFAHSEMIHTN